MIQSIKINNFFSFIDSKIIPNPKETILVGINGSGKSNFLKALKLLKEGISGIGFKKLIFETWGGFDAIIHLNSDNNSDSISIEYELDYQVLKNYGSKSENNIFYKITIKRVHSTSNYFIEEKVYTHLKGESLILLQFSNGIGQILEVVSEATKKTTKLIDYQLDGQESVLRSVSDPKRYFVLNTLKSAIDDWIIYDYFDTTPQSKIRQPMLPTSEKRLLPDGSNLPQILNTIKINDKNSYNKIKELLNHINPQYSGFDFNNVGINIELMLEETGLNKSVHVTHISDGTLRFLCILAICYNAKRGNLICIDEPEVGLHPDMISTIADALKHASQFSQIFIATHSEHVLNAFEIENVRVLEKDDKNSTIVNSFPREQFEGWYDDFVVGKMWRQNDLGGNRW